MSVSDRPLLIFVSDIHLTDALHGTKVSKHQTFQRFWGRIQASRGKRAAILCFVGDLFDIVRSPAWFETKLRPYDEMNDEVANLVECIIDKVLVRGRGVFLCHQRAS